MTSSAAPMDVPGDGIACDAPTNDIPPLRRSSNDNTRSEQSGRWTPEPQPATFDTLTEWGRKHLGEKWMIERESMIDDAYNSIAAYDPTTSKRYCERQKELRDMERELQRGKVELIGRELDELMLLARKRYGEGWYLNRRAARREQEMGCMARDFSEKMHHALRMDKRRWMASKIMEARDEAMLSEGYSWDQILGSSQPPNAIDDTDDTEACTPAMSENNPWVVTEANTSAATEANSELEDDDASTNESEYEKEDEQGPKPGTVESLEWRAVAEGWDDERYERARFYGIGAERSRAENEECMRRYYSEGPKVKKKREEREAHFFRVQHQAVEMIMELDGLDENPAFSDAGRYIEARARLDDYYNGDSTKLPNLELIAQELGIRRSLPEHHDGLSSGNGQEPTAPPKQQQRKRPGSPQHHERRQSRRLRQLPVEYKPEDPDKIIRLANAARRRGL